MNLPLVRLSRDGKWAVCFAEQCGFRFAQRFEWGTAVLYFRAGWVMDKTAAELPVWRMSRRVYKRLSQGHSPAFRRPPDRDVAGWLDPPWMGRDRESNPDRFSTDARDLPAIVICPACGRRQLADADALDCESAKQIELRISLLRPDGTP